MRALRLHGDRDLRLEDVEPPPPPGEGEVQLRIRAISLNHIDVWGWRGMAPNPARARERCDSQLWREALGRLAWPLRVGGIVVESGQGRPFFVNAGRAQ